MKINSKYHFFGTQVLGTQVPKNVMVALRDVATLWPGGAMVPPGFWEKKFSISIGIFNVNIQLAQKN